MIVASDDLGTYRGAVTMVDGGFDPLHPGHIAYFEAAAALGPPVLCNICPDEWVAHKHPLLLSQSERAAIIDSIRFIAYTHAGGMPTANVLRALVPRHYAKGADWRGRLPADEVSSCAELGIEVVFLDTVLTSSSDLVDRFETRLRSGS